MLLPGRHPGCLCAYMVVQGGDVCGPNSIVPQLIHARNRVANSHQSQRLNRYIHSYANQNKRNIMKLIGNYDQIIHSTLECLFV